MLAPIAALAQDTTGGEEILARIHFDPKTYELYRPWANKWFEELGKPQAPHRDPFVDRVQLYERNYGDMPLEWVRAILSTAASQSEDESEYVITVSRPPIIPRDACSSFLEKLVFAAFFERNGFAEEQWKNKKEEVDWKTKEIGAVSQGLENERRELIQNLERDRRAISDETLQQQIAAIEEGPKLELEMNLAELEARRDAIMGKLEETLAVADMAIELQRKRSDVAGQLDRQRLELAQMKGKARVSTDVPAENLERLEAQVDELARALEDVEREMQRVDPGNLRESLKEMLAQAEIDYAGFEARRKVLFDQYGSLKERLQQRVEIQNHIDELDSRQGELGDRINALNDELNSDEYRTPRPEIEWVPEPVEAAQ
jgi:hypothetical protein